MGLHFDEHAMHGKEFVSSVATLLNTDDLDKSGRMIRSVLRALRSRMTIEESFQLIGQLPMALKAVYVDGWRVRTEPSNFKSFGDFRSEILKENDLASLKDFTNDEDVDAAIVAVFEALSKIISRGEYENIKQILPRDISMLLLN